MQLLSCIRINSTDANPDSTSNNKLRPLFYSEKIMNWIEAHYKEPFDLEHLSNELHLSKSYISRSFKRETGSSLTEYLTIRRIKEACQLLEMTNKSIELIGESLGFKSVSYFIQLFKNSLERLLTSIDSPIEGLITKKIKYRAGKSPLCI